MNLEERVLFFAPFFRLERTGTLTDIPVESLTLQAASGMCSLYLCGADTSITAYIHVQCAQ